MSNKQTDCGPGGCSCCSEGLKAAAAALKRAGVSRRHLLLGAGTAAIGSWAVTAATVHAQASQAPAEPRFVPKKELSVLPVLAYHLPERKAQTSWRQWGGIQTPKDLDAELAQIKSELNAVTKASGLAVNFLPVVAVDSIEKAEAAGKMPCDVVLVYASGGRWDILDPLMSKDRPNIVFLRHRTGRVSLWYEILHPHFLRRATDQYRECGIDVNDVVVDDYQDLVWRLKSLLALRKTLGQRIVALGGAAGWGAGHKLAPDIARKKWHLDIREVNYDDFGKKLAKLQQDPEVLSKARQGAEEYLKQPGIELHTEKAYVENAFVLYRAFKDLMAEHETNAFTIGACMSAVMPISKTTACLTLSLLNDEGFLAFCESDFVVIPSGMLMANIMNTPVFLNDPTWPHHGIVTLAHCTAPRKMNGKTYEPTKIYTHFESDYGAAPKVEMATGTVVTNVVPDFESRKWVGALGTIEGSPFHDICRAQIDVAIKGDWQQLVQDMRGFHWMTVYGDCMKEVGYAIKHLGIGWQDVSTSRNLA